MTSFHEQYAKHQSQIIEGLERQTTFFKSLDESQAGVLYDILTTVSAAEDCSVLLSHVCGILRGISLIRDDKDLALKISSEYDFEKLLDIPEE